MPRWESGGKCTERTGVGDRWRFEIGPLTRRALEGFRRTDAADAPPRPAPPRSGLGPDRRRVRHRPRHLPPARAAPAAAASARRPPNAAWSTVRSSPCCFTGRSVAAEVAALCWADVDFRDGDDVVVTVRRSKSDPTGGRADVRRLVGGYAAAVRSLHAAVSPEPGGFRRRQDLARRPRRSRPSSSPREGLPPTPSSSLEAGKTPPWSSGYAASVSTREGAVSKYLR